MSARSPSPGLVAQGRLSPELQATSKHRSLQQVEWNRLISRATQPFFIPFPTPDLRGTVGADKPRRHIGTVDMDRQPPRDTPVPPDERDYTPVMYDDLHRHCGVNIRRMATRGEVFGGKKHDAETVVDAFKHPGWVKGTTPTFAKAVRDTLAGMRRGDSPRRSDEAVERSATPLFSAYKPLVIERPVDAYVVPNVHGGSFPKAEDHLTTDERAALDRTPLDVKLDAIKPHRPSVRLSGGAARAVKEKPSEKYRALFRTPPPAPLTTHEPRRVSRGFAPMRHTFRNSVDEVLRTAAADIRRAQRLMADNAAERSRSPLRSALIYSTNATPIVA